MENGKDTQVTNQNKFQFVDLWYDFLLFSIQTQTTIKVKRSVQSIKKGVSRIIPDNLLTVFQPY